MKALNPPNGRTQITAVTERPLSAGVAGKAETASGSSGAGMFVVGIVCAGIALFLFITMFGAGIALGLVFLKKDPAVAEQKAPIATESKVQETAVREELSKVGQDKDCGLVVIFLSRPPNPEKAAFEKMHRERDQKLFEQNFRERSKPKIALQPTP